MKEAGLARLHRALRNLRHLYEQMIANQILSQIEAANGLLSPAISNIELAYFELEEELDNLRYEILDISERY